MEISPQIPGPKGIWNVILRYLRTLWELLGALFLHYFGFQYRYGTLSYFSVILRYLFLTPGAQKSTATGVACYRDENRLCNSLWHRRAEQWLWKLTCMVGEGNDEVSIGFILAYPH